MRLVIPFILLACSVQAQSFSRNRLTFSGGWADQIGPSYEGESATSIGLTYGYRPYNHVEFEVGVQTALHPGPEIRGASYDFKPDDRYIWIPFGVRFIVPIAEDRFELSTGGGGLYQRYSISNSGSGFGFDPYHAWGGYLVESASVALDHGRHFWLGATPRFFIANGAFHRDRWSTITAEFSVRF
jgi:hypothetical protein